MITAIVWLTYISLPCEKHGLNRFCYVLAAILATIVVNR